MTPTRPSTLPRRRALLAFGAGGLMLAGCGGGSSSGSGTASVRAINLTSDIASADLVFNDTVRFAALAADTLDTYTELEAATYTLKLRKAGDGTTLLSGSYALAKDQHYTAVAWGRETAPRLTTLPEDETDSDIGSGNARLRIFSATLDSGAVDVYLTATGVDLAETAATVAGVTAGQLTGFREVSAGSYRLRVTGAGDPSDLRLDIASFTLEAQRHATLVLTPGAGGVLVNGRLILQQGASSSQKNTQARLRIVAGVDGAGNVAVSLAGRTLAGGLRSPSVGPYQLVDAGTLATTVRVNGAVVESATRTLVAGSDYTMLVHGSGTVALLVDDNRLPSSSTRVKLRLLNGAAGTDPLTLSVDYLALATDVPAGTVSGYASVTASSAVRLDVTSAAAVAPLYTAEDVKLAAQGVYTVFVLGGNTSVTGVIRKER